MPKIIYILFFIISTNLPSAEQHYVNGIEELPLATDMINMPNSLIFFDTNEGKFIQTKIFGKKSITFVKNFYNDILPNLGWKLGENNKFYRKSEFLEIHYYMIEKNLVVEFNIKPK